MKDFAKRYYDLLVGEYKGINLTRITDYEEFYSKQILDSIAPYEQSDFFKESISKSEVYVDIGFGGGFPLLPLAFLNPEKKFVGVETRGKKARVVQEIADKLGLKNVKTIHERIENIIIDKKACCSLKAVGKVNDFLTKFKSDQTIQVFFYKGPNFYELEKDQIIECKKDWMTIFESEIVVPNTDKRYLVGYENKKVPCGTYEKKTNNLVKLSDLL